ncbi:MAG: hypothetical protein ACI8RA_002594, partial [Chlamydiales bacterium]
DPQKVRSNRTPLFSKRRVERLTLEESIGMLKKAMQYENIYSRSVSNNLALSSYIRFVGFIIQT